MPKPSSLDPPQDRSWLAPAALLAAIAALLLTTGPRLPPEARPATAVAAAAAADTEPYDLDTAFNLAGEQVPETVEEYYFLVLIGEVAPAQEAAELAEKLQQAAQEHDYLGLTGPDPRRNRRVLLTALEILRHQSLAGLVVIYVGPVEQQEEIVALLRRRGIEPRFVVYPRQGRSI